MFHNHWSAKMF